MLRLDKCQHSQHIWEIVRATVAAGVVVSVPFCVWSAKMFTIWGFTLRSGKIILKNER